MDTFRVPPSPRQKIAWASGGLFDDLSLELGNQDNKWGQQDHDDVTSDEEWLWELWADVWKVKNDYRAEQGILTWDGILLEEVYEALEAAGHDRTLRDELIQVAGVALQWVAAIDRRANLD